MPRVSEAAIARDREASKGRYYRNREHARKVQRQYQELIDEERPFIGWDSEGYNYFIAGKDGDIEVGPQRTMLFGCSIPGTILRATPARPWISTKEMLDLLLAVENDHPDAFHVIYGGEYDFNQFLRDLPMRFLAVLKATGKVRWEGYRISHVPHKIFTVSKDSISATLYDIFGFFHSRYTTALEKYNVGSDENRARIASGKSGRGSFTLAEIAEVEDYMATELALLPELAEHIRRAAYNGGFRIHAWHGPGALAAYALRDHGMHKFHSPDNIPSWVAYAIRAAYAGGRFQAWQCGEYNGPVWTLDKNSAYLHAMAQLPRLDNGRWERVDPASIKGPGDISRFGIYHVLFDTGSNDNGSKSRAAGLPEPPYPLFCRGENGGLTWPGRVDGWYWSPEAALVAGSRHSKVVEAIVYRDDGTYPFKWVESAFEVRRKLQDPDHYNPAEKAYKWALAAMYGAFARRVGWDQRKRTAPPTHELAWAGFITSHCRAAMSDIASYAYLNGGLISVDTDGVTAQCPFPESLVSEGFGDRLGQWKQEKFDGILYWQNGIYWLYKDGEVIEAKSRGIPKGRISIQDAIDALSSANFEAPYRPAQINLQKTHYVGYRQALAGQHDNWRKWVTTQTTITMGGAGKGAHFPPFCAACKTGEDRMHTITHLPPKSMESFPHKLPWLEEIKVATVGDVRVFDDRDENVYRDDDYEDNL